MKKRLLFINFGGLGDEILFLPAIISAKKEFPESEITLALEPRSKGILSLTDVIDNVIFADIKCKNKYSELLKLLFKIWFGHFDVVISSGGNKFISVFLFLTFIKQRYGYNTGKLSEHLLTKAVTLNKNQYAVKMYHELVSEITKNKTDLPEFNITKQETEPNTVLIHPGVSRISIQKGIVKTVSKEVWAETVEKLSDCGKNVILAGGPDDEEIIKYISEHVSSDKFTNMYGKTKNLKELAELISKAEIFLCSDSAPLHIAVGLGVKTFVIFGSTDDKKLIPDNGNVIPVKAECDCKLQPCLWEKRQTTCESLDCLQISSDKIIQTVCGKI
jgi:ADP-heptose:LPS heptosyltransferase